MANAASLILNDSNISFSDFRDWMNSKEGGVTIIILPLLSFIFQFYSQYIFRFIRTLSFIEAYESL